MVASFTLEVFYTTSGLSVALFVADDIARATHLNLV